MFRKMMKSMKFTISQWALSKYVLWAMLNAFLWYRLFDTYDMVIINVFFVGLHICTRIHAVALGMIIANVQRDMMEEHDEMISSNFFMPPMDKKDIN